MAARRSNGASIRALRESLGIPHGKFAIRCSISPGYLTNIEKGIKQPSAEVARRIADELGVPLDAVTYPVRDEAGAA